MNEQELAKIVESVVQTVGQQEKGQALYADVTLDMAKQLIAAAKDAQKIMQRMPMDMREKIISKIRELTRENAEILAKMAVEENGMGNVGDKMITEYKTGLRANGVKPPKVEAAPVKKQRSLRRVPISRLRARLGLDKYNVKAPLDESYSIVDHVRIKLSQHIGAPAVPIVKVGDTVKEGQKIGAAVENALSLPVHASIDDIVTEVNDREIVIRATK